MSANITRWRPDREAPTARCTMRATHERLCTRDNELELGISPIASRNSSCLTLSFDQDVSNFGGPEICFAKEAECQQSCVHVTDSDPAVRKESYKLSCAALMSEACKRCDRAFAEIVLRMTSHWYALIHEMLHVQSISARTFCCYFSSPETEAALVHLPHRSLRIRDAGFPSSGSRFMRDNSEVPS